MGWNQPSHSETNRSAEKTGLVSLGLAAIGIAAGCVAVMWWFADGESEPQPTPDNSSAHRVINDVSRAKDQRLKEVKGEKRPHEVPARSQARKDNEALAGEATQAVVRAEGDTTNAEVLARLERFKKEPVKGLAEQLLMMVVPPKKGEIVPPPPIDIVSSPELEREAQAMLERQGVIEEWDDDSSIDIKERLEALKDEWYTFKKDGGSFHEFLRKRLGESNFNTQTLEEARRFDSESFHDQSISDDEYNQLHSKVNKLLEIQGFDKIERPYAEPKIEDERE